MKRLVIVLSCFIITCNTLLGIDIISINPEKVISFPIGNKEDEYFLIATEKDSYTQPCVPRFNLDMELIIFDPARNEDKVYTKNFVFKVNRPYDLSTDITKNVKLDSVKQIQETNKYIIFHTMDFNTVFFTKNQKYLGRSQVTKDSTDGVYSYVIDDLTFHWDIYENIFCNPKPTQFEFNDNIAQLLDESGIQSMLLSTNSISKNISIDENGILFLSGKPFLSNSRALLKYYKNKNPDYENDSKHLFSFIGGDYLLGEDTKGNTIWGSQDGFITIMSSEAFSQKVIRAKPNSTILWGIPCLHPSGDIYLIGYGKEVALYRIKRSW